jgi:prophage antirepressor-like protein
LSSECNADPDLRYIVGRNEIWFLGLDILQVFGFKSTSTVYTLVTKVNTQYLRQLKDLTAPSSYGDFDKNTYFVNTAGLCQLSLQPGSESKFIKTFQTWIFEVALPKILKTTEEYTNESEILPNDETIMLRKINEKYKIANELMVTANKEAMLTNQKFLLLHERIMNEISVDLTIRPNNETLLPNVKILKLAPTSYMVLRRQKRSMNARIREIAKSEKGMSIFHDVGYVPNGTNFGNCLREQLQLSNIGKMTGNNINLSNTTDDDELRKILEKLGNPRRNYSDNADMLALMP